MLARQVFPTAPRPQQRRRFAPTPCRAEQPGNRLRRRGVRVPRRATRRLPPRRLLVPSFRLRSEKRTPEVPQSPRGGVYSSGVSVSTPLSRNQSSVSYVPLKRRERDQRPIRRRIRIGKLPPSSGSRAASVASRLSGICVMSRLAQCRVSLGIQRRKRQRRHLRFSATLRRRAAAPPQQEMLPPLGQFRGARELALRTGGHEVAARTSLRLEGRP